MKWMEHSNQISAVKYLVYHCACSLNNKTEYINISDIDKDIVSDMRNIATTNAIISIPDINLFKHQRYQVLFRNANYDSERKKLFKFLDDNRIWYLPLKGIVLKDLYPKQGMRFMSDNDILFDKAFCKTVRDYFMNNGYEVHSFDSGHDDVYYKKPIFNFQMHRCLFEDGKSNNLVDYYNNISEKLLPDDNNGKFARKMTDEDFYLYFLAHTYVHYSTSGTGLRSLTDEYVYLNTKERLMNWEYIYAELKELKLEEFEKNIRCLSKKLFSDKGAPNADMSLKEQYKLNDDELNMLHYILSSGTYGNSENHLKNELNAISNGKSITGFTKAKYLCRRLWPSRKWMIATYPICRNHTWITPFYRVYRVVHFYRTRKNNIDNEVKKVINFGK